VVVLVVKGYQKVRKLVWWWLVVWVSHVGFAKMDIHISKRLTDSVVEHLQQLEVYLLEKDGRKLALADMLYVWHQDGDYIFVSFDIVEPVCLQCRARCSLLDGLDFIKILRVT
jgi:hypothetical protein